MLSEKGVVRFSFSTRNRERRLHIGKTLFREKDQLLEDVSAWLGIGGIRGEGRQFRRSRRLPERNFSKCLFLRYRV